jgi:hypothetical protein
MTNVVVTVTAPSSFIQQSSSKLGPVPSIAAGQSFTFQLDYAIDPNAVDGSFSVTLQATQDTKYVAPRILTSTVNFPIGPWPFFDGSAVVVVRQNAAHGGLKFGEPLRRREVGRLPSKFESYSAGSYGFERFASRRGAFAGCDARKVMRLATWPSLEVAGATLRRARTNLVAFASPSRARNCRLPVYIECASRIQTWESRVPEGTRTADLLIHIAYVPSSTPGTGRGRFAGSSGRSTNAVRRLKKVPAVGELTLSVRRGFLFVGTAGKAGKNVRGAMKGKLATSDELARSVSIFGAAFLLLGGHFASKRLAKCTPATARAPDPESF